MPLLTALRQPNMVPISIQTDLHTKEVIEEAIDKVLVDLYLQMGRFMKVSLTKINAMESDILLHVMEMYTVEIGLMTLLKVTENITQGMGLFIEESGFKIFSMEKVMRPYLMALSTKEIM